MRGGLRRRLANHDDEVAAVAGRLVLHARLGFEMVGTAREVGTKFGRWLDLTMMRLPL